MKTVFLKAVANYAKILNIDISCERYFNRGYIIRMKSCDLIHISQKYDFMTFTSVRGSITLVKYITFASFIPL